MTSAPAASIVENFASLKDPRINRTRRHELMDIIVIALCAVISGADNWVHIELFGKTKKKWFKSFLRLPHGIPSHDTFGRVFAALDAEAFSQCFIQWVQAVAELAHGEVVAIDGKTLRRTFDRAAEKLPVHMVSAWASANRMVLGQVKTEEKSNEITAIPRLLDLLLLKGCIVTIDAMGCQKVIAAKIVEKKADWIFGLKGNQEKLSVNVQAYFGEALRNDFEGVRYSYHEKQSCSHGRMETRRVWCTSDLDWCKQKNDWAGFRSIAMVERERKLNGQRSIEQNYYMSSLDGRNARRFASAVRSHWSVENSLHWVLDMAFRQDECRMRLGNAAANLTTLQHIAINLVKKDTVTKAGVKGRRLMAGWDNEYLLSLLGF